MEGLEARLPEDELIQECMYLAEWEFTSAQQDRRRVIEFRKTVPPGRLQLKENQKGGGQIRVLLDGQIVLDGSEEGNNYITRTYTPRLSFDWENCIHEFFKESRAVSHNVIHRG